MKRALWVTMIAVLGCLACGGGGSDSMVPEGITPVDDVVVSEDTLPPEDTVVDLPPVPCAEEGTPCDDGDPCTLNDTCIGGVCAAGAELLDCTDDDESSTDTCVPGTGCTHKRDVANCDDNNPCTIDMLATGSGCKHSANPSWACLPRITITYPSRGATVDGSRNVRVTGTIANVDGSTGGLTATLNDEPLTIGPNGTFEKTLEAVQGMNTIVISATDVQERTSKAVQAFYYSTVWYVPEDGNPSKTLVKDGARIYLGSSIWDDNNTSTVNDIATVIRLILSNMDYNDLIENPVASFEEVGCTYNVFIYNLSAGVPGINLVPSNLGLKLDLTVPSLYADVFLESPNTLCPNVSGTVTATSMDVSTRLVVSVSAAGVPSTTTSGTTVSFTDLDIDVGWAVNWLIDLFSGRISDMLAENMEETIDREIPPRLNTALASLNMDRTVVLPAVDLEDLHLIDPVDMRVYSRLSTVTTAAGYLNLTLSGSINSAKKTTHPSPRSIGRASCLEATPEVFKYPSTDCDPAAGTQECPLKIALAHDLLNQALFAGWYNGATVFTIPSSSMGSETTAQLQGMGITDLGLDIDLLLPPIVTSCKEAGKIHVEIGDIFLHVDMQMSGQPAFLELYASASVEVVLSLDTNTQKLSVSVRTPQFFEVQLTSQSDNLLDLSGSLMTLLQDILLPKVIADFVDKPLAAVGIPSFDLATLYEGVPEGSAITLNLQAFHSHKGFLVLSGTAR